MPADIAITETEIRVPFHRRSHLPIVLASGTYRQTGRRPLVERPYAPPRPIAPKC